MPEIASVTLSTVVPDGGGVGATRASTSPTVLVTGEGGGGGAALEISWTVFVTRRAVRVPTFPVDDGGELVSCPAPVELPPAGLGEGEAVPVPAGELPPPVVGAGAGEVLEGCSTGAESTPRPPWI